MFVVDCRQPLAQWVLSVWACMLGSVRLFAFVYDDEVDSCMCVLCLCARAGAPGLLFPFRLCGKLKGRVAESGRRKYFPHSAERVEFRTVTSNLQKIHLIMVV